MSDTLNLTKELINRKSITPEDGGKDVFVHKTGTRTRINEGDQVSYEVEDGQKGPSAVNVELV